MGIFNVWAFRVIGTLILLFTQVMGHDTRNSRSILFDTIIESFMCLRLVGLQELR